MTPLGASARRAQLLEALIVALTSTPGDALPIRTRVSDDPTIALLDAWATVGDVIGFYLDRIADEGYLSTATDPGSVLAIGGLIGYQPLPSVAAQTYLAYSLAPDPADNAVQFDSRLLFQTVPGPGQQPQTFESTGGLVARPSWNLLKPKSTQPVPANTTQLALGTTNANLAANDMILMGVGGGPQPVYVASSTVDYAGQVTNVALQGPTAGTGATALGASGASGSDASGSDASGFDASGQHPTVTSAIDALLADGLTKPTVPVPASANELPQSAASVFAPGSDAVPRLLSTLRPAVGASLYSALGTTAIGSASVIDASALRVSATPFGAQAPPRPVFNAMGQPAGTEDWPIGDSLLLQLTVIESDFARLMEQAFTSLPHGSVPGWLSRLLRSHPPPTANPVIDVQSTTDQGSLQGTIEVTSSPPWSSSPAPPSGPDVTIAASATQQTVTLTYTAAGTAVTVVASLDPATDAITLELGDAGSQVWDPNVRTPLVGQIGNMQLSIMWATPTTGDATLTLALTVALPPNRMVLPLDAVYDGIVPGTPVVIVNADDKEGAPVIAHAQQVDTVSISAYAITGKVTRLTLDAAWLGPDAVFQSALRPLHVYAQPDPLPLLPAPVTDDVAGSSIDLDDLVAGMTPGHLIAVTGTRTDLAGDAAVQSGEIAMVASVATGGAGGDTSYSTLMLAGPLAYTYHRATVQIYGNVVAAHQGATLTEVLGSGRPANAPQTFTLSSGPLLADPGASGPALTVTVDGVPYASVTRYDASTPPRSYVTGTDPTGKTTITFPAPLPAGSGNVVATYRAGDGSQGSAQAGQISQLLSRPGSLSGVTNPLAATGGRGGQDQESVRAAIPQALSGLGQTVTVDDYAVLARSVPSVGKAAAALVAGQALVTVAATDPVQIDSQDGLLSTVSSAIAAVADPSLPVRVLPANLFLLALTATTVPDPLAGWDVMVDQVRAALASSFSYDARALGQDVAVSDLVAAAHTAPAVLSFEVTGLALVPANATATQLSTKLANLLMEPVTSVATLAGAVTEWGLTADPQPEAMAYVSTAAPETLILMRQPSR